MIARYKTAFIFFLILLFGTPFFMLPPSWSGQNWYNQSIGNIVFQEKFKPYLDKALGGLLRPFVKNVYEKSDYRDVGETKLFITAGLPYGNTIKQMNYILVEIEKYIEKINGIDTYVTQIYDGQYGNIEITFDPEYEKGTLPYQLKTLLVSRVLDWGGVEWNVMGVGEGFNTGQNEETPKYKVIMKGYNFDELEKQGNIFVEKLALNKRIQKVNPNEKLHHYEKSSLEYSLVFDYSKLANAQTSTVEIINHIKSVSKPLSSTANLMIDNTTYSIVLKEKNADEFSTWNVLETPILLNQNRGIKLKEVSSLQLLKTSSVIHKEDRQYIRVIGFEYYGTKDFGDKFLSEKLIEMNMELPMGFTIEKSKGMWDSSDSGKHYWLIALVILSNLIICSIIFENLKQPVFVITVIPISFIGLFLIFTAFNFYFDQGGYAAFIMLGGLVGNSAIYIINDFNSKLISGRDHNQKLIKTIANRGRTILLTIVSSSCGMIPFLVEGQTEVFWFSFATGMIGGLAMSMFAVFVVLPTLMWKNPTASH